MTRTPLHPARSILIGSLLALGACAPVKRQDAAVKRQDATPSVPQISRIDPDSVSMSSGIVTVVVRGTGFAPGTPGANTIDFNGMTIQSGCCERHRHRAAAGRPGIARARR
jgi:hypothetical protein